MIYDIFEYCFDNYKDCNGYIIKYLNRCSPPKEETNALQEPMEEEIAETRNSLDEKEEESDDYDGDDLLQFPVPAGCQNGVSEPRIRVLMAAKLRNSFWKKVEPPVVFRSGALSSRKGSPRGCPRWAHHAQARAHPGRA